ncbi:MAG: hypothetical protein ACI87W_000123 [Halieaceae bacterium]|jgi:hypothetical protein
MVDFEFSAAHAMPWVRRLLVLPLALLLLSLTGCEDPQVYGSVGVSSGYGGYYGGYGGWNQPRMHTSISVGGRIR